MVRQRIRSTCTIRGNDGQRTFCNVCQCYVQNIRRHERTNKHRNNLNSNNQQQNRRTFSLNLSNARTNTQIRQNLSNAENLNNPHHDNSLSYDSNNLSLDHDSRSTSSNDDINSTTDNNSSSNNNDSNSDLSFSVSSDTSNNNDNNDSISVDENSDPVNNHAFIGRNENINSHGSNMKRFLMENQFSRDKVLERNEKLKHYYVQIKLLKILSDDGISPKLFDTIMDWVKQFFTIKDSVNTPQKFRTYDTLMKHIKSTYMDLSGGPTESMSIITRDVRCVTHCCGFLKNIYRILNSKHLMSDAQWEPPREINLHQHDNTSEKIYSEVTTGSWYKRTYDKMMSSHQQNSNRLYPPLLVALVLGQDGTLCDKIGRVSSEPVLVSVANIQYNKRKHHEAWFCLGFIPEYPKTQLESKKDKQRISTKELPNEYYSNCLNYILKELIESQQKECVEMMVNINGYHEIRTCYFEVAFAIGDALGNNKLCGRYLNFSNNIQRKQRECNVSHMNSDKVQLSCELNLGRNNIKDKVVKCVNEINTDQNITQNRQTLKDLSQHAIIPAHFNLSYGENSGGIHTATPPGVLHVLCENGLFKYLLRNLYDCVEIPDRFAEYWRRITTRRCTYDYLINEYPSSLSTSEKKQNKFDSTEYERRIRVLVSYAKRQSDRSMIKCSTFRNGVTQLSRLNGQEYPGLVLLTMICIDGLMSSASEENKFRLLLNDSLVLYKSLMVNRITDNELSVLERKIEQYLKKFKTIIGPLQIMRSNVGLKLTKFHSLVHLPYFVKEYGAPMNFFEGHLEEFLKHFVKKLYARTTRQHSRYLYDLTCRLKEVQCLDVWEEDNEIFNEFPNQHRNNNETDDCEMNDETHNVNREYYDHEQNFFLCGSKFKVVRSEVCNRWHTHKNHEQSCCSQSCQNIPLYHPWCNNNFYNKVLANLTETMDAHAENDESLKTNSIIICSECQIPSNRHDSTAHDILRAHPHYKPGQYLDKNDESCNSSWHDWVEVEYDDCVACGKLLLWCWIEFLNIEVDNDIYAMVQTLTGQGSNLNNITVLQKYDSMPADDDAIYLIRSNSIKSVAYVLPSIKHSDTNRSNYNSYFSSKENDNKHFMIIKPVELW